jgi:hypothetical protein
MILSSSVCDIFIEKHNRKQIIGTVTGKEASLIVGIATLY